MKERVEVVWPLGQFARQTRPLAPRLDTLEGKTICGIYNGSYYFDQTWPLIQELLKKEYPGIKFVSWDQLGIVSDNDQGAILKALPDKLIKCGCDAVISGRGC